MDFVTHAAVGAMTGRALSGGEEAHTQQRLAILGGLVALLPDADHVLEFVSAEAYLLQHRTASHSLLVLSLVVVAAALLPGKSRGRRTAVVALSLAAHLTLDVLTPFGTGLTWPFSDLRVALDGLPIVCPWLALPALFLAVWSGRCGRAHASEGRRAARIGLLVVAGICAVGLGLSARGRSAVKADGALVLAVPDWRFPVGATVIRVDGVSVQQDWAGLMAGPRRVRAWPRVEGGGGDWASLSSAVVAAGRPLSRFRLPAAELEGGAVRFYDAQFSAISPERRPFTIVVSADGTAVVEQLALGAQPLLYLLVVLGSWLLGQRALRHTASRSSPSGSGVISSSTPRGGLDRPSHDSGGDAGGAVGER